MREQSKSLELCRQETARQNEELNIKFESRNRGKHSLSLSSEDRKLIQRFPFKDLKITDNADSQAKKCEKICEKNARYFDWESIRQINFKLCSLDSPGLEPGISNNKTIRFTICFSNF